jgi:coenzyme F420-dependent glucose-6-phosphate dehydrogenase
LGFTQVFDYVAGKADWLAYGLPREGKRTSSPYVGDLVRRDVPICHPDDRVGEVAPRVQTVGWNQCVVVNRAAVVLGVLRGEALHAASETPVELAMESGPTTIRCNRALGDIRAYMRQHGAESVVVTTPTGQLVGLVERQDIERHHALAVPPHAGRSRPQHGLPRVAIGYKLSCEEHSPSALVGYARQAEDAGFTFAMLSDHYHPWIAQQGQSPFVWSVIGAIAHATERLQVGTGVTCPLIRIHPAIVAQAAATAAALLPGRFILGVGSGESLNEHIFGDYWPPAATRRAMLEEAVAVIRRLWHGGLQSHQGQYYTLENAQLYTLPEQLPSVLIAASGTRSAHMAGRIGDGLITVGIHAKLVDRFVAAGGGRRETALHRTQCLLGTRGSGGAAPGAREVAHCRPPGPSPLRSQAAIPFYASGQHHRRGGHCASSHLRS